MINGSTKGIALRHSLGTVMTGLWMDGTISAEAFSFRRGSSSWLLSICASRSRLAFAFSSQNVDSRVRLNSSFASSSSGSALFGKVISESSVGSEDWTAEFPLRINIWTPHWSQFDIYDSK